MAVEMREGKLLFSFENSALSCKFDDMSFYRGQFVNFAGGSKAVDFICLQGGVAWLIEVKDYRRSRRQKVSDLFDEVAAKVRDSLVCCVAGALNANDANEQTVFRKAIEPDRFRVVLHLEQNDGGSRLFPPVTDRSKCQQKLKQLLRALNAKPIVVDQTSILLGMPWTVRDRKEYE